jgi:hypothetical protein
MLIPLAQGSGRAEAAGMKLAAARARGRVKGAPRVRAAFFHFTKPEPRQRIIHAPRLATSGELRAG